MALTAPTADLTGNTIASTYDQLLILDNAAGIVENTLKIVSTQLGHSALQIDDEKVLIKGVDTSNAIAFEVQEGADATAYISIGTGATTKGVTINESGQSDIDFRVEGSGAANALFVDGTNGYVGIGTATPDNLIEIAHTEGAAVTGANIANNTIKGIHISGPYADADDAGSVLKFSTGVTTGDVCQSAIAHIQVDDNNADLAFYTDTSGTLNEAMRIDNSQNIGIGTVSPGNKLTVDAEAVGDGIDIIDGDITHGMTQYLPTDAVLRLTTQNASEGGGRILGATENGGQHGLTIYGLCPTSPTTTVNNIQLIGARANSTDIQAVDADKQVLQVKNYTTALMTILGNGNVGVGIDTPNYDLHVSNSANTSIGISSTGVDAHGEHWYIKNDAGTFKVISADLNYGGGVARLQISNTGVFTGNSSADISDKDLKKNIKSITGGLDTISKLQGRTFEWKESANMSTGINYGLIAQELETVLPDLISDESDFRVKSDGKNAKSITMSGVIPILIEAVKELSATVDILSTKVTALENA